MPEVESSSHDVTVCITAAAFFFIHHMHGIGFVVGWKVQSKQGIINYS